MIYKEYDIDISTTNAVEGGVVIPLPNNEVALIWENTATPYEREIIRQINEDVANRPVQTEEPSQPTPTPEERIAQLEQEKAALEQRVATAEQDNLTSLIAIAEIYEMLLGGS